MQPMFPREVTSNVPRITLTGQETLHVEQHRGLVTYGPEKIELRTAIGLLRVTGSGLRFTKYLAGEAHIAGRIDTVGIEGGRS